MEYALIRDENVDNFSKAVTKKLKEGYQLYGDPGAVFSQQADKVYHYQALTKSDNKENN